MRARLFAGFFTFACLLTWMNTVSAADDLSAPAPSSAVGARGHGGGGTVTILRGTPSQPTGSETGDARAQPQIIRAGVIGTGNNLWFVDADQRIHACWLSGTGYVNSLKVTCTH